VEIAGPWEKYFEWWRLPTSSRQHFHCLKPNLTMWSRLASTLRSTCCITAVYHQVQSIYCLLEKRGKGRTYQTEGNVVAFWCHSSFFHYCLPAVISHFPWSCFL
jgi:hypothetical protein